MLIDRIPPSISNGEEYIRLDRKKISHAANDVYYLLEIYRNVRKELSRLPTGINYEDGEKIRELVSNKLKENNPKFKKLPNKFIIKLSDYPEIKEQSWYQSIDEAKFEPIKSRISRTPKGGKPGYFCNHSRDAK